MLNKKSALKGDQEIRPYFTYLLLAPADLRILKEYLRVVALQVLTVAHSWKKFFLKVD